MAIKIRNVGFYVFGEWFCPNDGLLCYYTVSYNKIVQFLHLYGDQNIGLNQIQSP